MEKEIIYLQKLVEQSNEHLKVIRQWVTFFGVIAAIGTAAGLIVLLPLLYGLIKAAL